MLYKDPIVKIEEVVRGVHDQAGEYTKPVRKRYPLTFAVLFTFSAAAIFQGFEIWANNVVFFQEHPFSLMTIGMVLLIFTGGLYKALQKAD